MISAQTKLGDNPWYREPWPWILMAGPFIVVIAGIFTAWLAIRSNDGLVTEDYYKKGLAVNLTIAQSERAIAAGLLASLSLTAESVSVRLLARDTGFVLPDHITLTISHPTRAGLDQSASLTRQGNTYTGNFHLPVAGHWLVLIEDEHRTWRLLGNATLPASGEISIGGDAALHRQSVSESPDNSSRK